MDTSDNDNRLVFLVLRAQAGDADALDQLFATVQEPLFGYLTSMLRNESLAEDALQLTFIQIYRKLRWLREPSLFQVWMYRIASRVAYRRAKKFRRMHERSNIDNLEQIAGCSNDETVDERKLNELIGRIPDWMDQLTHRGREVIVLHYLKGFTVPQVAEILGIPLGTASRISYALLCIRKLADN